MLAEVCFSSSHPSPCPSSPGPPRSPPGLAQKHPSLSEIRSAEQQGSKPRATGPLQTKFLLRLAWGSRPTCRPEGAAAAAGTPADPRLSPQTPRGARVPCFG